MRAMVLEEAVGPHGLRLRDVPMPEPGPGEVRVSLRASALNRRDHALAAGRHPGTLLPCVLGSDGAGIVDAVGKGVDQGQLGRAVMIYPARAWGPDQRTYGREFRVLGMPDQGTFAEAICVPAADVADKPAHLSWDQAAAIPLAGLTTWRAAITHGEVAPGQRVLITGAGAGTASFAIQWCARKGAEVWVTSGSAEKIERARSLGAAGGVNYREEGWSQAVRKLAGGFDLVIDSAGGEGMNLLLDTLRPAGRYVFFGATLGNPQHGPALNRLFVRHIRIQGTTMGSPEEFAAMMAFVADHRIVPLVDRVLPLERAADGLRLLQDFGQAGKIVLHNGG